MRINGVAYGVVGHIRCYRGVIVAMEGYLVHVHCSEIKNAEVEIA